MLVGIVNSLHCLSRAFWQATSVINTLVSNTVNVLKFQTFSHFGLK